MQMNKRTILCVISINNCYISFWRNRLLKKHVSLFNATSKLTNKEPFNQVAGTVIFEELIWTVCLIFCNIFNLFLSKYRWLSKINIYIEVDIYLKVNIYLEVNIYLKVNISLKLKIYLKINIYLKVNIYLNTNIFSRSS